MDQDQSADPGRGKIERCRAAQAADAGNERSGIPEPSLMVVGEPCSIS